MDALAAEMGHLDGEDPRQAARLMKKLSNMTGLKYGQKMEEALKRLESGENPDAVEADIGDVDEHDLFEMPGKRSTRRTRRPAPRRDSKLYKM